MQPHKLNVSQIHKICMYVWKPQVCFLVVFHLTTDSKKYFSIFRPAVRFIHIDFSGMLCHLGHWGLFEIQRKGRLVV